MPLSRRSYVHGISNKSFIGMTMHELLEERVEKHPDREMHVFVSDNERITYAGFKRKVVDLAAGFLNLGLCKGDCVAVMGANHMEWPLINGAARAIGVATVCLQIGHPPETISVMIRKTSCRALFITRSPENLYSDVCKIIPELSSSTPGDLKANNFPSLKLVIAAGENHQDGTMHLDDIYISGCEESVNEAARNVIIDDIGYMCMTSGTTGTPKLVHYTHFRALNSIVCMERMIDADRANIFACCANMAYTDGAVISQLFPLLFGVTCVYPSPGYAFEKFLQAVQDESITTCLWQIDELAELAYSQITSRYDLSSLRGGPRLWNGLDDKLKKCYSLPSFRSGSGSLVPPAIPIHLKKKFNIDILNVYGSTEIFDISCVLVEEGLETSTTVGRPVRNMEIQIVDPNGLPVKVGDEGEVWIRNQSFRGYYEDIEKTKAAMSKGGWFRMGDVGKLDTDGYLTLVGRIKDIIIRRGLNIHPFDIENILTSHPAVEKVQVVGIPDYRIGEDLCACIILKNDHTLTAEDMKKYCVDKCYVRSLPTYCLTFESFPLGITGKIDRNKLKEMAISRITIPEAPYANV